MFSLLRSGSTICAEVPNGSIHRFNGYLQMSPAASALAGTHPAAAAAAPSPSKPALTGAGKTTPDCLFSLRFLLSTAVLQPPVAVLYKVLLGCLLAWPLFPTGYFPSQLFHCVLTIFRLCCCRHIYTKLLTRTIFHFHCFAVGAGGQPALPVVGLEQRTLGEKNLLLRGSVLRATEWAICVVVYTGADTKLSLNSKKTPSKLSSVDRIVNRTLVVAISVMILVCLISMVFGIVWENEDSDAKYLCLDKSDLSDRYTQGGGCENGSTSSILTIFTFATLYNNFVCISMYVSLELVYLCQAYFLSNDINLYDESTDTPAECHTSGMCADLGQVKYVLSDKTGTLTKNLMVVQHFSIAEK